MGLLHLYCVHIFIRLKRMCGALLINSRVNYRHICLTKPCSQFKSRKRIVQTIISKLYNHRLWPDHTDLSITVNAHSKSGALGDRLSSKS
jgi:hypothetical protein